MTNFWHNKNVIVTGGAGFVGSHLVRLLSESGASVTITVMDIKNKKPMGENVRYLQTDVSIYGNCLGVFKDADVVFNLAAKVAGVEFNQSNHDLMNIQNLALQTIPVDAAAHCKVPHFLQVSSVCVYPDGQTSPCDDSKMVYEMAEPNGANIGYAMAKREGEMAVIREYLPHWIIARPTNIYGPGDDFGPSGHVIPALIKKAVKDAEPVVNGTGQEVREFIFVEDVARAFMHLIEHAESGVYNIGTNGRTKTTILELMRLVQAATGTEHKTVLYKPMFDSGDSIRYTNSDKLEATGFKALVGLSEGLASTIREWRQGE